MSPLFWHRLVCGRCGREMKTKVVMGRKSVDHIEYTCINPTTECNYKIEQKIPVPCEMKQLRQDGSEVRV
jgi:hypothetical protein